MSDLDTSAIEECIDYSVGETPAYIPPLEETARAQLDALKARVAELEAALRQIANRTYPASYIGMDTDGTRVYGHVDDASRYAREVLEHL